MSYILDALRRADAERQRDALPGLNATAMPGPALPPAPRRRVVVVVIVALALALAGLTVGWRLVSDAASPAATALPSPAPASPAPSPTTATAPTTPVATAAATPAANTVAPSRAAAGPPDAGPLPPSPAGSPPGATVARKHPTEPAPAREPVTPPRPVTTPPPRLADLSAAFRRELPTLTVSGVVYAAAASSRLAVVNGQVMREGESLPSGVTLERVFPLAAVFTYRGQRFEVAP